MKSTQAARQDDLPGVLALETAFDQLVLAVRAINGEFEVDQALRQHLIAACLLAGSVALSGCAAWSSSKAD